MHADEFVMCDVAGVPFGVVFPMVLVFAFLMWRTHGVLNESAFVPMRWLWPLALVFAFLMCRLHGVRAFVPRKSAVENCPTRRKTEQVPGGSAALEESDETVHPALCCASDVESTSLSATTHYLPFFTVDTIGLRKQEV
mmetsp:Transcript_33585/g.89754  ORF Transcript_33585/g.89754 Transcript_33585/m.89754 type:complete len:139 (-) Transcript_33585:170-586(-)